MRTKSPVLALLLGALLAGAFAVAAPPEDKGGGNDKEKDLPQAHETPSGVTTATPGGGNANANSDNAATPASRANQTETTPATTPTAPAAPVVPAAPVALTVTTPVVAPVATPVPAPAPAAPAMPQPAMIRGRTVATPRIVDPTSAQPVYYPTPATPQAGADFFTPDPNDPNPARFAVPAFQPGDWRNRPVAADSSEGVSAIQTSVPPCINMRNMCPTPDNRFLFVPVPMDDAILVIGGQGPSSLITRLAVGAGPVEVKVSKDGKRAYVACYHDGSVAVIDVSQLRVVATIRAGTGPVALAMSRDGHDLYVANSRENTVSIIDASRLVNVATVPVGQGPTDIRVRADGKIVWVSNANDSTVTVIDAATRSVIATIRPR